jgi:hypothetical protein
LTLTNGLPARVLCACSSSAATSFPVPDSPTSMTAAIDGAIRRKCSVTSFISGDSPSIATAAFRLRREPRVRPQPGDGPKVAIVAGPSPSGDCVANSTNVTSPLSYRSVMVGDPFFY